MARKKELTEEQVKEIQMLRTTNEMLAKSKDEAMKKGKTAAVKQIERAEIENIEHIKSIDPSSTDTVHSSLNSFMTTPAKKRELRQNDIFPNDELDVFSFEKDEQPMPFNAVEEKENEVEAVDERENEIDMTPSETTIFNSDTFSNIDPNAQFDVIQLPSNGQCYKSKVDRVPVSYLTAYDENIITSPNLYKDGLVIDYLLKNKVESEDIKVEDLVSGDADAIILYLRATSYGADFPIVVMDPESGEQIETTVDLTTLKPREFKLVGDENGFFDYETPFRHDKVKFRYLTRKQERQLRKITEIENYGTKAAMLDNERETLLNAIVNDKYIPEQDKKTIRNAAKVMETWSKKLKEVNSSEFTKIMTNNLLLQVVSVNGNTDRDFIKQWVMKMPARDALMLRRYINDNRPGIDFDIEVERPESLGGGSFKTFLNWDDSVFLNISDV